MMSRCVDAWPPPAGRRRRRGRGAGDALPSEVLASSSAGGPAAAGLQDGLAAHDGAAVLCAGFRRIVLSTPLRSGFSGTATGLRLLAVLSSEF